MNWLELETDWIRRRGHSWFSAYDEDAISAFEEHLETVAVPFVKRRRSDAAAVVFEPLPVPEPLAA